MKANRIRTSARVQQRARELRKNMTSAERILWGRLSNRQLAGFKFRRQHPIGTCIVDFYCAEASLVIEVDGSVHLWQAEADAERNQVLEQKGYQILHFTNEQIETDLGNVLSAIQAACQSKAPLPNLGEGLG